MPDLSGFQRSIFPVNWVARLLDILVLGLAYLDFPVWFGAVKAEGKNAVPTVNNRLNKQMGIGVVQESEIDVRRVDRRVEAWFAVPAHHVTVIVALQQREPSRQRGPEYRSAHLTHAATDTDRRPVAPDNRRILKAVRPAHRLNRRIKAENAAGRYYRANKLFGGHLDVVDARRAAALEIGSAAGDQFLDAQLAQTRRIYRRLHGYDRQVRCPLSSGQRPPHRLHRQVNIQPLARLARL